jgi:hypothetical protein
MLLGLLGSNLLRDPERRPWMRIQVAQYVLLSVELRMLLQILDRLERPGGENRNPG